jgi:rubrerythrin
MFLEESMSEDKTVEILKNAILLEKRGKAFYQKVAEQASGKAVKAFFEMMADEEVKHVKILADQYTAYQQNQKFNPGDYTEDHSGDITSKVITAELRAEISAVDYEAAAISAAMSMEENAIKLYADRAAEADDPNEKALYKWLAEWENQHLHFLSEIDKELKEQVWNDNSFWPF